MKKVILNAQNSSYNIYIGENILNEINSYLDKYDKVLILSNENILPIYKEKITDKLKLNINKILFYSILDGEKYKNVETMSKIIEFMLENNFSRKSVIVCIGGGVVCDIGGFTASVFMRGIDFIQVPTSLLAQVDASIGGKTAVNHERGKNTIGVFSQPKAVFIDIEFLRTLPKEQFLSGMGEIIKHGIIDKKDYLEFLDKNADKILNHDRDAMIEMIEKSCIIKRDVVQEDEKENSVRTFLNLGHTYSHAIENIFAYEGISHGEGVAKGIIFQYQIGKKLGYIEDSEMEKIKNIFVKFGIDGTPIYVPYKKLIDVMKKDKKNSFEKIKFVLKRKEDLIVENISEDIIKEVNNENKNRFVKGVIDIGTNSCRLFLAEVEKNNKDIFIKRKLYKETRITKLGTFVDENGNIKEDGIKVVIDIIKDYKKIADSYGTSEIIGFGTSATREAKNGEYFLNKIYDETDVRVICISGEKEAELTFLGAISEFRDDIVLVDSGGGSTEIIYGDKFGINYLKSFKAGVVRDTEKFFKNEDYSKIEDCVSDLKERFRELKNLKRKDFELVGVAGTVTTNVSVKEKMKKYDTDKVHMYVLSKKDLEENLKKYLSVNLEERKKIVGLEPKRADVIISGTIIILVVMETLGKDTITVSECDNLEGAMIKL